MTIDHPERSVDCIVLDELRDGPLTVEEIIANISTAWSSWSTLSGPSVDQVSVLVRNAMHRLAIEERIVQREDHWAVKLEGTK